MHTLHDLSATDFRYQSGSQAVERNEVMPEVGVSHRLGLVMGTGDEGLGAANFLLSCVIAFYDTLRERKEEFFEYPDFYTFQATTDPADYRMFDVFPDHKDVEVEPEAETILRAVNDRGITTLLVPSRPPNQPDIEDVTLRSAERTIEQAFLYSPSGQLDEAEFQISLPRQLIHDWFKTTIESMTEPPSECRVTIQGGPQSRISQGYRELSFEDAMGRLP